MSAIPGDGSYVAYISVGLVAGVIFLAGIGLVIFLNCHLLQKVGLFTNIIVLKLPSQLGLNSIYFETID